jgi:hypothetical protein
MPEPHAHLLPRDPAPAPADLLPMWVSGAYAESSPDLRVRMLECLLRPMGVLALVGVAGGVFAQLRQRTGWQQLQVTLEDTLSFSAEQVLELATYVQQSTPDVFGQVADLLTASPGALGGLSAALLLHALRRTGSATSSSPRRSDAGA